jgi:hypothetical protein
MDIQVELQPVPKKWWLYSLAARCGRKLFDMTGYYRGWFNHYQIAKRLAPTGFYRMTKFSQNLKFDINLEKFNKNFNFLYQHLEDIALLNPSSYNISGFPIRISRRDEILNFLYTKNIYPPVHWKLKHKLSQEIMTIPCDSRYDLKDMERIVNLLRQAGVCPAQK